MSSRDWPLILRTGFGNIFRTGRWTYAATVLIAEAINSGEDTDWCTVEAWARNVDWDASSAS